MITAELPKLYKVYMLRCSDGSLYTGYTDCVNKRYRQHLEKSGGAKYTRRGVEELVFISFFNTRADAMKEERRLKSLKKIEKEELLKTK